MALNQINITSLDFDDIKNSLIEYLKSQQEFSDYEFEGSALSNLIDILAYNTNQNAYIANMLLNEKFLDSAVKRSSITSIAKHLGYTPRSSMGAVAHVKLEVINPEGNPLFLTLPKNTPFTTTISGNQYSFFNPEPITIEPKNGRYIFEDVLIKEGTIRNHQFVVVNPGTEEKYEIPFSDIDISTLTVWIQPNPNSQEQDYYARAKDLIGIDDQSKIYFVEESTNGRFILCFGDDIIGKKLSRGNIIRVEFMTTAGGDANIANSVAQNFQISASIGNSDAITVDTLSNSTGGGAREGIESIRYNAPKFYASANRAINETDYDTLVRASYPNIESVSVWGGENNIPPVYGKVFISLKPFKGGNIDAITKSNIASLILKDKQMMTIIPEFKDPDYIYINTRAVVEYDRNLTSVDASSIGAFVRQAMTQYFSDELQQFKRKFQYSRLIERLNNAHYSIKNVLLDISLQKRIVPAFNVNNSYIDGNGLRFNNKITPGSLKSTKYYGIWAGTTNLLHIQDDGQGNITLHDDEKYLTNIGTIDYTSGRVNILSLAPTGYPSSQFDIRITALPVRDDLNIEAERNQIIELDDSVENYLSDLENGVSIQVIAS